MLQSSVRARVRLGALCVGAGLVALLASCGGGGASREDAGTDKTYLRVDVADANADPLSYQWRVTGGTIENRNNRETVWTMPAGPGLHFAYVMVTDGRGGQVEYQYAAASDKIDNPVPARAVLTAVAPTVAGPDEFEGSQVRLRLFAAGSTDFAPVSGAAQRRRVYLPDVQVRVTLAGDPVFAGATDLGGEVVLPRLVDGQSYDVTCTTLQGVALSNCGTLSGSTEAQAVAVGLTPDAARNLRVYGHVGLSDGGVCGGVNPFFAVQNTATVQVVQADGTAMTAPVRVNRFGDYALDAAVPVMADLRLKVQCGSYSATQVLTRPGGGYAAGTLLESSHVVPNERPRLLKMVATGPDGNVRGQTVEPLPDAYSNGLPGSNQFLSYKGLDTKLGACRYYRAFGAVRDCDAQGNMIDPITLDDWKRQHRFKPYAQGNTEVEATYINQRDLNLVRRMSATQTAADNVAFVVCNHPGPEGDTQREADQTIDTALANEKLVACVAMEYSVTPGRNGGLPFTKFLTFAPNGSLVLSVNLDGRGEKYLPGACVACHGGVGYAGRFAESGNPTPDLKASFLPFDTGNYKFSSTRAGLNEQAQSAAIRQLNDLVVATNPTPSTQALVQGWYASNPTVLDKTYVPPIWAAYAKDTGNAATTVTATESARFYREVVGTTCRTCHAAMRPDFDWDNGLAGVPFLAAYRGSAHICGGGADVHVNASMPNALISQDRLQDQLRRDAGLAELMTKFLGCSQAAPDPVYPKR